MTDEGLARVYLYLVMHLTPLLESVFYYLFNVVLCKSLSRRTCWLFCVRNLILRVLNVIILSIYKKKKSTILLHALLLCYQSNKLPEDIKGFTEYKLVTGKFN